MTLSTSPMLFDATLPPTDLSAIPSLAQAAESMGFNALWSTETMHDPFLPGALIAEHTRKMNFGTAVAIAFARSPGNTGIHCLGFSPGFWRAIYPRLGYPGESTYCAAFRHALARIGGG